MPDIVKAVVVHSNVADAHQRKIARGLERAGFAVERLGFARHDWYGGASSNADVLVLGMVGNESYARRIPAYFTALPRLRRSISDATVVVVFSAELAMLSRLAIATRRRRRGSTFPLVIRELADVPRVVDGTGRKAAIARATERVGASVSDGFLVTSPRFEPDYVRTTLKFGGPVAVVENKPDLPHEAPLWRPQRRGPLTIGYFGLLRCTRTLEILRALAADPARRFDVVVHGYDLTNSGALHEAVSDRFRVRGEYSSPRDLVRIYGECDVVYSGYPYDPARLNARLATTNRYAEAIHFGLPQIAHRGTEDGRRVEALGLGVAIDPAVVDNAVMQLLAVSDADWEAMATRAAEVRAATTSFRADLERALGELRGAAEE